MQFRFVPMTEADGRQISEWAYPAPYEIYSGSGWEQMAERQEDYADPMVRSQQFSSVRNGNGELCGFAQFFPIVGVTRLGLGLRPDLCGQGIGTTFVQAIAREAKRRSPANEVDLEVLVWNERAIRTYEKAGFQRTDTYNRMTPTGMDTFHCMVYRGGAIDA
jgi:RimJ/RimL family protein N-acetyltransferase